MKMVEISLRSITTELEKAEAQLVKAETQLVKKTAIAEKLNCKWTREEHIEWMNEVRQKHIEAGENQNDIIFLDKEEAKVNGAWFDWVHAQNRIEELQEKIERIKGKLEKAEAKVDEYHKNIEIIEDAKKREELWKLEFEAEQKEWLKDGIKLEGRYYGTTPSGKRFGISSNCGFTVRSLHCFTLYLNGNTIFTSGEFWRCYLTIKNN